MTEPKVVNRQLSKVLNLVEDVSVVKVRCINKKHLDQIPEIVGNQFVELIGRGKGDPAILGRYGQRIIFSYLSTESVPMVAYCTMREYAMCLVDCGRVTLSDENGEPTRAGLTRLMDQIAESIPQIFVE